jgi:hypothetical protein
MKTITTGLLWLLICNTAASLENLAGKVELKLHANKTQVVSGEWIFFDCSVRNLVAKDVQLPLLDGRGTGRFISFVDSKNERVPGGIVADGFGEDPVEHLPPKSTIVKTFSLALYGNADSFTGLVRNLKPGFYRVWVKLSGALSDTLEIEVVAPKAGDKLVAERLNARVCNYVKATLTTAIHEGRELIRANPQSPYLPNAYYALMSALNYSDNAQWNSNELRQVSEEFIARFPDFGGVERAVRFYALAVQNSVGARHKRDLSDAQLSVIEARLRALKRRYAGSRLTRYVNQEIASLRKNQSQ